MVSPALFKYVGDARVPPIKSIDDKMFPPTQYIGDARAPHSNIQSMKNPRSKYIGDERVSQSNV
jgi:hypothetical protein